MSIGSSRSEDTPNNLNRITTPSNNLSDFPKERLREKIAQTAQGRVGVTATVLETGKSVSLNGNQRFPMQSVYKLPIAMAILDQVDRGKLKLNQKIQVRKSYYLALVAVVLPV